MLPSLLLLACTGSPPPAAADDPLAAKGRAVYLAQCIACHNTDPTKPGAVGPPVQGSSRELIHARVIEGAYPPGYAPKRTTTLMVPLPQLAGDIDALAAFLK